MRDVDVQLSWPHCLGGISGSNLTTREGCSAHNTRPGNPGNGPDTVTSHPHGFELMTIQSLFPYLSNECPPRTEVLSCFKNWKSGTSLVAQWIRICLPVQGTRVQSLIQEEPACHGAAKPVCHNYWACTLEPASHNYWAHVPQLLKPARLEPVLRNKRSHRNEKPAHRNEE